MKKDYNANDYAWIRELLQYPLILKERLGHFKDTSEIQVPEDPIERVIFQDHAKISALFPYKVNSTSRYSKPYER